MSGLTPEQFILRMDEWNQTIKHKIKSLILGARFYRVLNLVIVLGIGVITAILLVLDSVFLSDPDLNYQGKLSVAFIILFLQIILAIFNGFNTAVTPGSKSNNCSLCAKQYSELSREIDVEIDKHKNFEDNQPCSALMSRSLYFSEREQIILYSEPLLIFIGHDKGNVLVIKNQDIKELIAQRKEMLEINNPI